MKISHNNKNSSSWQHGNKLNAENEEGVEENEEGVEGRMIKYI